MGIKQMTQKSEQAYASPVHQAIKPDATTSQSSSIS